jgi:hypothetical protein
MLQRNIMLSDRGNEIISQASTVTVREIGHQIFPDGSIKSFEREVELERETRVDLVDWQCRHINFEDEAYTEIVQAKSEHGPMNFAYLALADSSGAAIEESLWTRAEIDATEERFAMRAALED